jgi:RNA polymerase sigma-70 factor (ECF subfamily)
MVVSCSGDLGLVRSEETSQGITPEAAPASGTRLVPVGKPRVAFAEFYRTHFAYVWKSARRLGVQLADLDDVVQETFLTVHRLLDSYEEQGTEQGWLFSILFRVVQRHRRMHSRKNARTDGGAHLETLVASSADAPDRNAEAGETVRLLEEILDALDPDQRAVLVLADIEEKTVAEVAQILGLNTNTAASRLRIARRHVETAMTRYRARDGWRLK